MTTGTPADILMGVAEIAVSGGSSEGRGVSMTTERIRLARYLQSSGNGWSGTNTDVEGFLAPLDKTGIGARLWQ